MLACGTPQWSSGTKTWRSSTRPRPCVALVIPLRIRDHCLATAGASRRPRCQRADRRPRGRPLGRARPRRRLSARFVAGSTPGRPIADLRSPFAMLRRRLGCVREFHAPDRCRRCCALRERVRLVGWRRPTGIEGDARGYRRTDGCGRARRGPRARNNPVLLRRSGQQTRRTSLRNVGGKQ